MVVAVREALPQLPEGPWRTRQQREMGPVQEFGYDGWIMPDTVPVRVPAGTEDSGRSDVHGRRPPLAGIVAEPEEHD